MERTINITGDGNAVGKGNTTNVNKTTVDSGVTVADFTALLAQLRGEIERSDLDPKTRRIVESDLQVLEGEVEDEKPNKAIIETKLKSIEAMAKSAAGISTVAVTLSPMVLRAIEMIQGLF